MLSANEKDYLLEMIFAVIGEDQAVRNYKSGFNEETVAVVEQMIEANASCNENMRKLAKDLLGGSGTLAKGWLKKVLKSTKKKVSASELRGYGCLVSTKSRWKTRIISTAI
ncbi:hypothetical protein [Marinobacter zhanjiangensis]|uniref:Uncharacterized protein n=1 Tax=Marinobacter zhanjiangensis TaxID=578215 RepID=A0ABQ3B389_9GAMM|nr:hypothetical protein [Marinobacter zhanjiangensis]GGY76278.1 hypothetical protein GCM10007071_24630 [Marinobacter zhanjiangensis]